MGIARQSGGRENPQRLAFGNRLRTILDPEFPEDVARVDLDRMQREEKPGRDLLIG